MQVDFRPRGIHLPDIDLWLDCTEDCWNTWMSHAHSDHAHGLHGRIFGTPETLGIYRERVPIPPDECPECTEMPFGQEVEYHDARLTAFPASHILGAAQLLIEYKEERLIYTGDIKLRDPLCGVSTEVVACDRLIVESTFGLPIYRFLSREQARDRITAFARECLAEGVTPVFVGYPLGRGQEIVHVLCDDGIPRRFTARLPGSSRGTSGRAIGSTVGSRTRTARRMVEPWWWFPISAITSRPAAKTFASPMFRDGQRSTTLAPGSGPRRSSPTRITPTSTNYSSLVDRSGAREVDVVHGYTQPFARMLRERGLDARAPMPETAREAAAEQEG